MGENTYILYRNFIMFVRFKKLKLENQSSELETYMLLQLMPEKLKNKIYFLKWKVAFTQKPTN